MSNEGNWCLKHFKAEYFHYLQITSLNIHNRNSHKNHHCWNNQAIIINIHHQNQIIIQIYELVHHILIAYINQKTYFYPKKSGRGIKI